MRYIVQWAYSSSLGGPWNKGQAVEVAPETAEAIDRTSPGVLIPEPIEKPKPRKKPGPKPGSKRAKATGNKRVVESSDNR